MVNLDKTRMASGQNINKTLAENSALLFSITDVPEIAQEHELPADDQSYQLTVEREKQLAEDFAFLSAYRDDVTRVMAVAIEEDLRNKQMTIRLASNTGDLSKVKQGFISIGDVLQRAASRGLKLFRMAVVGAHVYQGNPDRNSESSF